MIEGVTDQPPLERIIKLTSGIQEWVRMYGEQKRRADRLARELQHSRRMLGDAMEQLRALKGDQTDERS